MVTEAVALPLPNRRATRRLARHIAEHLGPGDLVILTGSLGAGKTFLTRGLFRELGVPARERITSPTFSLVEEYEARLSVRHADLYRVEDESEIAELGLGDARAGGAALIVEWGAPYVSLLGGDALLLTLEVSPGGGRLAKLSADGARSRELCAAILRGVAPAPL